jgi:hypothetical protein
MIVLDNQKQKIVKDELVDKNLYVMLEHYLLIEYQIELNFDLNKFFLFVWNYYLDNKVMNDEDFQYFHQYYHMNNVMIMINLINYDVRIHIQVLLLIL